MTPRGTRIVSTDQGNSGEHRSLRLVRRMSRTEAVGVHRPYRKRDVRRGQIVVRYPDAQEADERQNWLQAGAAVAKAVSKGLAWKGEVCLCCGTWRVEYPAAPLSCGSSWRVVADATFNPIPVEGRDQRSDSNSLWSCGECGQVFVQSGAIHREGEPLSLLSGIRFASCQEGDDK